LKIPQNDILLSFIIPVYNVENYINDCVYSILNQNCSHIEVILVNDGSTDSSGILCDKFAENSSLVQVVHQKNGGHSSARNAGLKLAKGKYVAFIDSDDFISETCIREMLLWTEENTEDICFLNAYKYFPDSSTQLVDVFPPRSKMKGKSAEEALKALSMCEKFPGGAWGKLFNREFLIENGISFPQDLLHGEDLAFIIECMARANTFDRLDLDYYYYRQERMGSVTSCKKMEKVYNDLARFVKDTVLFAQGFPERQDSICSFAAYEYAVALHTYCLLKGAFKSESSHFFKEYKYILKYGKSKKLIFVRKCVSFLGIKITSYLMYVWMRIR